ncbi:hypothetical protein C8Q76DRAFT_693852 [Earliella scabrosa]|nr:hypothetical protein C8Q76DRAFT_693852 [Earliella scabrosa]
MPMLFSRFYVETPPAKRFVPISLWPYVRRLDFVDQYTPRGYDQSHNTHRQGFLEYELDFTLSDAFARMPNLRTANFRGDIMSREGVPWMVLSAVLSTPHIRNLRFAGPITYKRDSALPERPHLSTLPAITSLIVAPHSDFRKDRFNASDAALLDVLARHAHASFEVLTTPCEIAPLTAFWQHDWPRLRELTLRGQRCAIDTSPEVPMIVVLARMPNLRTLTLELAQPRGLERQPIWPPRLAMEFPWPALETLRISFPDPDDQIYAHLPHTLRKLALRCWPRHYVHPLMTDGVGWHSPVLTSSEMLSILRRCGQTRGPFWTVENVDLEFEEDGRDLELFRCIPSLFPNVKYLTIHRYRRPGVDDTDFIPIAQALAQLTSLRVLRFHLDLKEAPDPITTFAPMGNEDILWPFLEASEAVVDTFARTLAPPTQCLCVLCRTVISNEWFPYRIVRSDSDGSTVVRTERVVHFNIVDKLDGLPRLVDDFGDVSFSLRWWAQ